MLIADILKVMDHVVVAFTIGGIPILMKSTDEIV